MAGYLLGILDGLSACLSLICQSLRGYVKQQVYKKQCVRHLLCLPGGKGGVQRVP